MVDTGTMVAIIVPVLGRPHRVGPLLADITAGTPEPHRVLFVCDPDDHATIHACSDEGADWLADWSPTPSYATKIDLGYQGSVEPWIFTAADDLHFHRGWLTEALRVAELTGAKVVGTVDLTNDKVTAGEHSTHTLIARSYCDDPGACVDGPYTVMHPGYSHEYVDDELVCTAKARGVWAHASGSVVEHLHHRRRAGQALPDDDTYRKGRASRRADRALFESRRHLWEAA